MADYDIGDRPSKVLAYADGSDVATDPTGVYVEFRTAGTTTVTTYTAPDATLVDNTGTTTGEWLFTPPAAFATDGNAYGTAHGLVGGVEVAEAWTWVVRPSAT